MANADREQPVRDRRFRGAGAGVLMGVSAAVFQGLLRGGTPGSLDWIGQALGLGAASLGFICGSIAALMALFDNFKLADRRWRLPIVLTAAFLVSFCVCSGRASWLLW